MKKLALILAVVLAFSCLTACGGSKDSGSSSGSTSSSTSTGGDKTEELPEITWRCQSVENAGTPREEAVYHYADLVKEATGGKFTIEVYDAGTLYAQDELIEAVKNGVTECAVTSNDYQAGIEPMLKMAAFRPADPWSDEATDEEFLAMFEPLVREAYEKMGLVYVGNVEHLPIECFMSNVKIESLDDFNGLLIRTAGLAQELYQAMGGSAVNMPMGDVYSAAKLGTIDAFEVSTYADNYGNALHEVCKYVIEPTPHNTAGTQVGNFVVNPAAYDKLPEEYKQALADCCAPSRANCWKTLTEASAEAREKILATGVELCQLTDEEFDTIHKLAAETMVGYWGKSEACDEFLTIYIEFLESKGYEDVAAIMKK